MPIKKIISIQSLIEHSVKFALMGPNIQSQLFFQEDLWPVEVDEGQMSHVIQKEHLLRIFDPYFTTKTKGSGLGLSITHSIIKRHQDYITAETNPGGGTTFLIYLPASPQPIVPQEKTEAEAMARGKGRVLVMDDEESVLNIAEETLTHLGYEVDLAKNGTETVKIYKRARESSHPFDVVITDLTVPGDIGGVETLRRIREIDPNVKVIVSSGYSNDPAMADFQSFGFTDCLKKPYRASEVSQTGKRVLKTKDWKINESSVIWVSIRFEKHLPF
ncbi:MAG: response regulator [Nitrospiria bacterium]